MFWDKVADWLELSLKCGFDLPPARDAGMLILVLKDIFQVLVLVLVLGDQVLVIILVFVGQVLVLILVLVV